MTTTQKKTLTAMMIKMMYVSRPPSPLSISSINTEKEICCKYLCSEFASLWLFLLVEISQIRLTEQLLFLELVKHPFLNQHSSNQLLG